MTIDLNSPQVRGWELNFLGSGKEFNLAPFDRVGVLVKMQMKEGAPFTRQDVLNATDRDITVKIMCEMGIIGGMTYRIDPDLETYNERGGP